MNYWEPLFSDWPRCDMVRQEAGVGIASVITLYVLNTFPVSHGLVNPTLGDVMNDLI